MVTQKDVWVLRLKRIVFGSSEVENTKNNVANHPFSS